tara:strand:+ start:341 stop:661 length:321 start_codon:yes stop_codon:yes gene_type:complete
MNEYSFLKWSPNIRENLYKRSKLNEKHKSIGNNVMETILQEGNEFISNNNNINNNNKIREKQFEKMNEREMVAQTNLNPFLSNNYLEDLQNQEKFLTPQNSNLETK